jgi:hypothetical protein
MGIPYHNNNDYVNKIDLTLILQLGVKFKKKTERPFLAINRKTVPFNLRGLDGNVGDPSHTQPVFISSVNEV